MSVQMSAHAAHILSNKSKPSTADKRVGKKSAKPDCGAIALCNLGKGRSDDAVILA